MPSYSNIESMTATQIDITNRLLNKFGTNFTIVTYGSLETRLQIKVPRAYIIHITIMPDGVMKYGYLCSFIIRDTTDITTVIDWCNLCLNTDTKITTEGLPTLPFWY